MLELIPTFLGVIAVLLFVYAIIARRRWLETKSLLADTLIRFEASLEQGKQAEQLIRTTKEQGEKFRQQFQKLEKQIEDSKQRLNERNQEVLRLQNEFDERVRKAESQKEHLMEQVQVLTLQLSEAVKEKKASFDELSKSQKDFESRLQKHSENLRQQISELQGQVQGARRDKQQLQSQLEKLRQESDLVKPEELKRWQLKVSRLEQLYTSMKGLRELAEERNRNWETALRIFACHILNKPTDQENGIGAVVGEALERIGAHLVHDDEVDLMVTASAKQSPTNSPENFS